MNAVNTKESEEECRLTFGPWTHGSEDRGDSNSARVNEGVIPRVSLVDTVLKAANVGAHEHRRKANL
jgi:hypothetical protein